MTMEARGIGKRRRCKLADVFGRDPVETNVCADCGLKPAPLAE